VSGLRVGSQVSLCRGCGRTFKSTRQFDLHRTGKGTERRCMTEDELFDGGFRENAEGRWSIAWVTDEGPEWAKGDIE